MTNRVNCDGNDEVLQAVEVLDNAINEVACTDMLEHPSNSALLRRWDIVDAWKIVKQERIRSERTGRLQRLHLEVLGLFNTCRENTDLIKAILELIKEETGIQAVAIRLQKGDDYPYFTTFGMSEEFVQSEFSLYAYDKEGNPSRDENGFVILECMCGNIIRGRTNPQQPCFTVGGSFWCNNTAELLADTNIENQVGHARYRCIREGYLSVALIPLKRHSSIVGLLQFNDKRKDRFTKDFVELFEQLGAVIGIALEQHIVNKQKQYLSLLDATLESTADAIVVLNINQKNVKYNKKFKDMWCFREHKCEDRVYSMEAIGRLLVKGDDLLAVVQQLAGDAQTEFLGIARLVDGRAIEYTSAPQWLDGLFIGRVMSFRDVTERVKCEEVRQYQSTHDLMTGLFNRIYFETELQKIKVDALSPLSVISSDVNNLKMMNDIFGHERGDELIIAAARVLTACSSKGDFVVRYGGDEFLLIMPDCNEERAQAVQECIQAKCAGVEIEAIPLFLALGSATTIDSSTKISTIANIAETHMYQNKLSLDRHVRSANLDALTRVAHAKDDQTAEHSMRMKAMAVNFARRLRLSEDDVEHIAAVAEWHDIGKVTIPEAILQKETSLTNDEWEVIKSHSQAGYWILRTVHGSHPTIEEAVLAHHEHWDGSGYPRGLKGEDASLLARIISIIDAYDIITHNRPYQKARSTQDAVAELQRCAGSQFDPQLVVEFVEFLNSEK